MSLYSFLRGLFSASTKCILRARVEGSEHVPEEGACIFAANHLSFWDPVILVGAIKNRELSFLARSSLFSKPVVGYLLRKTHSMPVERNGSDLSAIRAAISILKQNGALAIYPQGTRCPDKEPAETEFHDGAAYLALYSGATVVPVGVYTKNYRIRWFRRVYVVFGEPIAIPRLSPDQRKKSLKAYTEKIRDEILNLCSLARAHAQSKRK